MIFSKIAIIDDDPRIIQSLTLALKEYGVVGFTDSQKALEFLTKSNDIKLIILDVCMKGLNGLEVLERIRKANKEISVIMITGQATQEIIIEALRFHADDFIEKPFDVSDLKDRIKKVLKIKEAYEVSTRDPKVLIERVKLFIERNYKDVSLNSIADHLCLSPKYLGQLFVGHNKQGFRAFKLQVRMEQAKSILKDTSMPVCQMASQLGYENPESFLRAFKNYYNQTPKEYRESSKQRKNHGL